MTRLLTRIGAGLGVTALLGGGLLLWARYGPRLDGGERLVLPLRRGTLRSPVIPRRRSG